MNKTWNQCSFPRVASSSTCLSLLAVLLSHSLQAQVDQRSDSISTTPPGGSSQEYLPSDSPAPQPGDSLRVGGFVDYSYVAPGDPQFRGVKGSGSDAQSLNAAVSAAFPLDQQWYLPLSLSSANFALESVPGMPIPDHIDTLRLMAGVGYRLNPQWTFTAVAGPALYRLDGVDGDDVGVAGLVGAVYRANPDLTWAFGIGFMPDRDIPVLPAAGVRWNMETNLTLNLMFPRPRLIYRPAPRLDLYVGGDIKFAVFRADGNQGNNIGLPQFNNALGTYRDFHLGLGAEYEVLQGLSIGIEGGYSVGREIDYNRLNETVKFDPSPYVTVAVRYRF